MIAPADRQPIVVADAGPLIRLAAAGILDTLRGLNRRIVLVDRVEKEVTGDLSKTFAFPADVDRRGLRAIQSRSVTNASACGAGGEAAAASRRIPTTSPASLATR